MPCILETWKSWASQSITLQCSQWLNLKRSSYFCCPLGGRTAQQAERHARLKYSGLVKSTRVSKPLLICVSSRHKATLASVFFGHLMNASPIFTILLALFLCSVCCLVPYSSHCVHFYCCTQCWLEQWQWTQTVQLHCPIARVGNVKRK